MNYADKNIPKVVSDLIERMLDEDCLYPPGTAENAVGTLLERSIKLGKERQFKEALRFWKNANRVPEESIWQWFNGVFRSSPSIVAKKKVAKKKVTKEKAARKKAKRNEGSNKHKPGPRKRGGNKR